MSLSRKDAKSIEAELTASERHLSATFSVFLTYPITHTFITPAVRWQASKYSLLSNSVNTWFPSIYKIVLQHEYQGKDLSIILEHTKSLYKGYFSGKLYKALQANLRYPVQQVYLAKINKNSTFDNFSEPAKQTLAGSGAAITEAILHPFDSYRNILINEKRKLSNNEKVDILKNTNIKLLNGIQYTVLRNSIGGATQFGVSALLLKHYYKRESKNQLTKTQHFISSWISAVAMIFATMPFDNLKLKKQLESVNHDIEAVKHKLQWKDLFNFRGGLYKAGTRSIAPAATMAVYDITKIKLYESRDKRVEYKKNVHTFFSKKQDTISNNNATQESVAHMSMTKLKLE